MSEHHNRDHPVTKHDLSEAIERLFERLAKLLKREQPLRLVSIGIGRVEPITKAENMLPLQFNVAEPLAPNKQLPIPLITDHAFDPDAQGLIDGVAVIAGDSTGALVAGLYNQTTRTFDTSDPTQATAFVRGDGSPGAKEIDFSLDPHPGAGTGAGFLVVKVTYTVAGTPPPADATTVTVGTPGTPEDITPTPATSSKVRK